MNISYIVLFVDTLYFVFCFHGLFKQIDNTTYWKETECS